MERSLISVVMDSVDGKGQSLVSTILFAVLPIAKVFTICFMGCLMASKYVNILSANGRKLLNGVSEQKYFEHFLLNISVQCISCRLYQVMFSAILTSFL